MRKKRDVIENLKLLEGRKYRSDGELFNNLQKQLKLIYLFLCDNGENVKLISLLLFRLYNEYCANNYFKSIAYFKAEEIVKVFMFGIEPTPPQDDKRDIQKESIVDALIDKVLALANKVVKW